MTDAEKLETVLMTLKRLMKLLLPPRKVLVVEDDSNDWELLKRELCKFDCEVTWERDGEEAVKKIKEGKFDLVLMDVQVPRLAGNEILQETVGFRNNTRVIIVTGYPGAPQISRALEQGAILTLPKPVTAEQLKVFLTPYVES